MEDILPQLVTQVPALGLFVWFMLQMLKHMERREKAASETIEKIAADFSAKADEFHRTALESTKTLGGMQAAIEWHTKALEHVTKLVDTIQKKLDPPAS